MRLKVGLLGIGKIARDQHIPSLRASPELELAACASRNASVEGVASFPDLEAMLAGVPRCALRRPGQGWLSSPRLGGDPGLAQALRTPPFAATPPPLRTAAPGLLGRTLTRSRGGPRWAT